MKSLQSTIKSSPEKTQLLATPTLLLKKKNINIRYAELGNSANPPVLSLHCVPEN